MSTRQILHKTIIERGASWTLEETKLLLALWGQDLIQRQSTNAKRSKEVYEKISDKFEQNGFERTPDQVRTRVFNMIAEYRRILKDPNPERMKKCIFYEPLDRIYHAKHMDEIKTILDDYEPEFPFGSPSSNAVSSEKGEGESISDGEATDGNDTVNTHTPSSTTTTNNNASASASGTSAANETSVASTNSSAGDCTIIEPQTIKEEKESHTVSSQATGIAPAKRIRLESPKSNQQANQTTSTSTTTTSTSTSNNNTGNNSTASLQDNSSTPGTSSKQTKSSQASTSVPLLATTIGGTPISSSSTIRTQQSLLMPHVTASSVPSTSTPITKFTTSANNNNTPSYININSTKLPIIRTNQIIGPNGNESINLNGTATRLPTTAAISHQLYQAPVNTFDVTSSALLIDRMFAHLSRESENMREWIALEKERLAIEKTRRQQETEREFRRERVLMDTLMKFQDQWLSFLSRLDPRIIEGLGEAPPELKVPPRHEAPSAETIPNQPNATLLVTSVPGPHNMATYSTLSNNNNSTSNSTSKQAETDK